MDGLRSAAGAQMEFEFGGEKHILGPITLEHFGMFEQHLVREKRRAAVREATDVADLFPAAMREPMLNEAKERARAIQRVQPTEVFAWLDTPEGVAYTLWLLFEDKFPGKYTHADIQIEITRLAMENAAEFEQLKADRDQAAGLDESPGNPPVPGAADPGDAPGSNSSGDSLPQPKPEAAAGSPAPSSG